MPFGQFKGRLLSEIDDPYLLWLLTLDDLRDPLLSAVEFEADRRMQVTMQEVGR
jgi:hypothetical protein